MEAPSNIVRHQEGPSKSGESLTSPLEGISPIVSGGGKCCFLDESPLQDRTPSLNKSDASMEQRDKSPTLSIGHTSRKRQHYESSLILDSDDYTTEDSDITAAKINSARKGRGRPPTTGKYVGLAKAKQELRDLEHQSQIMEAEVELKRNESLKSKPKKSSDIDSFKRPEELSAQALKEKALISVTKIFDVAKKSKNLKGSCVKELNEAAMTIRDAVLNLTRRTKTQENRHLGVEIMQLKEENKELREEIKALQAAVLKRPAEVAEPELSNSSKSPLAPSGDTLEELKQCLLKSIGTMLDARFAGIEDRLLPASRLRPPLAADKRNMRDSCRSENNDSNKNISNATATQTPKSNAPDSCPSQDFIRPSYSKVLRRGKQKPKPAASKSTSADTLVDNLKRQQTLPETASVNKKKRKKKKGKSENKSSLPKPPKTSAVVLSLLSEAQKKGYTYAQALIRAKNYIKLEDLGIERLGIRTAVTGAKIIEVTGDIDGSKADLLAEKMRTVLNDVVLIRRPQKLVSLRIIGLDDSISVEEIKAAVAEKGRCKPDCIKVGSIRAGPWGTSSSLVHCPVTAAKTIVSAGKLLLGWSAAHVKVLERRPLRCFRCMNTGHSRQQCTSAVDRSDMCYRCGEKGHKAADCTASPKCSVCLAAKLQANHLMGGRSCNPFPAKMKRTRKAASQAAGKSAQEKSNENAIMSE